MPNALLLILKNLNEPLTHSVCVILSIESPCYTLWEFKFFFYIDSKKCIGGRTLAISVYNVHVHAPKAVFDHKCEHHQFK